MVVWQAIRYRRGQAVAIVALSAVITACAVIAPLYDRALQQALTRITLDGASVEATAVSISSFPRFAYGFVEAEGEGFVTRSVEDLDSMMGSRVRARFGPPVGSTSVVVTDRVVAPGTPVGELLWRAGACARVRWDEGRCPRARDEIAISSADVLNFDLRVGSRLRVIESVQGYTDVERPRARLRVVGVYRQQSDDSEYWVGRSLTGVSGFRDPSPPYQAQHDTWLTSRRSFPVTDEGQRWVDPTHRVDFALQREEVGVDQMLQLGAQVEALISSSANESSDSVLSAEVRSELPGLASTVELGRDQARITVPLLMLQLALLALVVFWLVLGAATEQRRPEVALARLRGRGVSGARRLLVGELVPVAMVGVALGVGLGFGLAGLARRYVLAGRAPFEVTPGVVNTLTAVTVLIAALTWLAARRVGRAPVSDLLRRVPPRAGGWRMGVGEAMVIAAASTTVAAFVTGSLTGPMALVAPSLLALVLGLLLARAVVPVSAWSGRRLLRRGWYAAVAVLATARRPATRLVVAILTVSSALLVFSAAAVSVGARNRDLAARQEAGAPMVATVRAPDVDSVRRALSSVDDPRVTPVFRVLSRLPVGPVTMAVVPEEFPDVALWPGLDPDRFRWSAMAPPPGEPVTIQGRRLSLRTVPRGLRFKVKPRPPVVALRLDLITADGAQAEVVIGLIQHRRPATITAAVPCRRTCVVANIRLQASVDVLMSGRLDIRLAGRATGRGREGTTFPADQDAWLPAVAAGGLGRAVPEPAPAGTLRLALANEGGGDLDVRSAWLPDPAPTLFGSEAAGGTERGATEGNELDGESRTLADLGTLVRVPGVEQDTVLIDVDLLSRWGRRLGAETSAEVWFATEDAALYDRVEQALAAEELPITSVTRLTEIQARFESSVPAWSLQLGVLVGVVGALLGAVALLVVAATTWRLRSRDLAALRMGGASRGVVRRIASSEQLPVVGLALLAGAASGLVGAFYALPIIPLFTVDPEVSTLDLTMPWEVVAVVLAAESLVLGGVSWASGRAIARRATLTRLRETL